MKNNLFFLAESLYNISHEAKGLRGFVGNLGRELEKELADKFDGRIERNNIDVRYNDSHSNDFFELIWDYSGNQYYFSGVFSLNRQNDSSEVIIDKFSGIRVCSNPNFVDSKKSSNELRISADMQDFVFGFLDEKFGKSIFIRGNGPIYRTDIPEEFKSEVT